MKLNNIGISALILLTVVSPEIKGAKPVVEVPQPVPIYCEQILLKRSASEIEPGVTYYTQNHLSTSMGRNKTLTTRLRINHKDGSSRVLDVEISKNGHGFSQNSKALSFSDEEEVYLLSGGLESSPFRDISMSQHLLRPPWLDSEAQIRDLGDNTLTNGQSLLGRNISVDSGAEERFEFLSEFPIDQLLVTPGHAILRSEDKIRFFQDKIKGKAKNTKKGKLQKLFRDNNPIILNITTSKNSLGIDEVRFVEIQDGHHRLVALSSLGYKKLGELFEADVRVLVNGHYPHAMHDIKNRLPTAGVPLALFTAVTPVQSSKFGTFVLPEELSNFDMGSRTTLGHTRSLMLDRETKPKVGVVFGDFDFRGRKKMLVKQLKQLQELAKTESYESIVLVPNEVGDRTDLSSTESRLNYLISVLPKFKRLNLYLYNSYIELALFGTNNLVSRIGQLYATSDVSEIHLAD